MNAFVIVLSKAQYPAKDEYCSIEVDSEVSDIYLSMETARVELLTRYEQYLAGLTAKNYVYIHTCGAASYGWFELTYSTVAAGESADVKIRMQIFEKEIIG